MLNQFIIVGRIVKDLEKESIPGKCDKCGSTEFDIGFMNWD